MTNDNRSTFLLNINSSLWFFSLVKYNNNYYYLHWNVDEKIDLRGFFLEVKNMQISNFSLLFPLWAQWKAFLYKEIQFQYAKLVTCKLENLVDFSLITRFYCIYKRSLLSILLTKLVNHCICIKGCDYQNTFSLWIVYGDD